MTSSPRDSAERIELVGRLCNEDLDVAGQQRLAELLAGDIEAQREYVRYVDMHAMVRSKTQAMDDEDFALMEVQAALNAMAAPGMGSLLDHAHAECDDGGECESAEFASSETNHGTHAAARWFSGAWGWTAAAAALAFAVWLGTARPSGEIAPSEGVDLASENAAAAVDAPSPAHLSGSVGARWAGEHLELPEGHHLLAGQRLELIEGLAEILFEGGVRVVLQGPTILEIESPDSMRVSVGRLAAVASDESGKRFTLRTKVADIEGLKAEFGAEIDVDGSLVTQVYEGMLNVRFKRGSESEASVQLASGQQARIDGASGRISPVSEPTELHFVRFLPEHEMQINLVDVVAGGDALRGPQHLGIGLVDGRPVDHYGAPAAGDGKYHRVDHLPYVDGVFIPDGGRGPVQIDSIGRTVEFPDTAGDCWGGGVMARRVKDEESLPFIQLEFHGDNYGYVNWLHIASKPRSISPEGLGLLGMHSNCGITFDLHAIRAQHTNKKMTRFRATVGNLESKPELYRGDAWVFVDGQLRYSRKAFSREDGPEGIDIPLTDTDRFLVLAVTDAGARTAYDWVAFGDPVIEMISLGGMSARSDIRPPHTASPDQGHGAQAPSLPSTSGRALSAIAAWLDGDLDFARRPTYELVSRAVVAAAYFALTTSPPISTDDTTLDREVFDGNTARFSDSWNRKQAARRRGSLARLVQQRGGLGP
jgi:hypothetical protein